MPKVSIIVPVFNRERYLATCVESIQAQSLADIEILLIDDGSEDSSLSIAKELAGRDRRIVLDRTDHQGAGPARNRGLALARGEFIQYVDSDDRVDPDFCSAPLTAMEKDPVDLIVFGYRVLSQSKPPKTYLPRLTPRVGIVDLAYRDISVVWDKMYRKDFLDRVRVHFPSHCHEDSAEVPRIINHVRAAKCLPVALYNWRDHGGNSVKLSLRQRSDGILNVIRYWNEVARTVPRPGLFLHRSIRKVERYIRAWANCRESWADYYVVEAENLIGMLKAAGRMYPSFWYLIVARDGKSLLSRILGRIRKKLRPAI